MLREGGGQKKGDGQTVAEHLITQQTQAGTTPRLSTSLEHHPLRRAPFVSE